MESGGWGGVGRRGGWRRFMFRWVEVEVWRGVKESFLVGVEVDTKDRRV